MEEKIWKTFKSVVIFMVMTSMMSCITAPTPAFVPVTPVAQAPLNREDYAWQSGDEVEVSVQLGSLKQAYLDSAAYEAILPLTNSLLTYNTSLAFEHNRAVSWISSVLFKSALQTTLGVASGTGLGILIGLLLRR